jgi:hypothetical protein
LDLSLKDEPVNVASIIAFENKTLLVENTKAAVRQIMENNMPIVMPLYIEGKYWSGLVIKRQPDGSLQVIYNEPMGKSLMSEKNAKSLIAAITELIPEVHIFDIRCTQIDNPESSGAFTVNNLVKLAMTNTSNFHKKDFYDLLSLSASTSENIDELREIHAKLIYDYVMPIGTLDQAGIGLAKGRREAFEHKGDYDGKEENMKHAEAPPPYAPPPHGEEEAAPVQMHVPLSGDIDHHSELTKDIGHA